MTLTMTRSDKPALAFTPEQPLDHFPALYRSRLKLTWDYWFKVEDYLERCGNSGDRFVIRLPGTPPILAMTSPSDIREVFTSDPEALSLGAMVKRTAPHERVFGPEIVQDGPEQVRRRKMLNPNFHGKALEHLTPIIEQKTEEALRSWPLNREVPFQNLIQPVVMDVIIAAIFGITEGSRAARIRDAAQRFIAVLGSKRFLFDFMVAMTRDGQWRGQYRYLQHAMDEVDAVIREEMMERKGGKTPSNPDLLDAFLSARDEEGQTMSEAHILNAMRGLLVAGYDTTAISMTWLVERLARHPDVMTRLHDEIDSGKTRYVEAVVYESLRCRPPLFMTGRMVTRPCRISDIELQPGVLVAPMIWQVHHRADLYPEPERFMPERFLEKRPDKYEWIPFGGGSRICLGMPLALLELNTFVRMILQSLRIETTGEPGERLRRRAIVLGPSEGARVTLVRR